MNDKYESVKWLVEEFENSMLDGKSEKDKEKIKNLLTKKMDNFNPAGFRYINDIYESAFSGFCVAFGVLAPVMKDAQRYAFLRDSESVEVYFETDKNPSGWGSWDSWSDKDFRVDEAMHGNP